MNKKRNKKAAKIAHKKTTQTAHDYLCIRIVNDQGDETFWELKNGSFYTVNKEASNKFSQSKYYWLGNKNYLPKNYGLNLSHNPCCVKLKVENNGN